MRILRVLDCGILLQIVLLDDDQDILPMSSYALDDEPEVVEVVEPVVIQETIEDQPYSMGAISKRGDVGDSPGQPVAIVIPETPEEEEEMYELSQMSGNVVAGPEVVVAEEAMEEEEPEDYEDDEPTIVVVSPEAQRKLQAMQLASRIDTLGALL